MSLLSSRVHEAKHNKVIQKSEIVEWKGCFEEVGVSATDNEKQVDI